ncbi:MAG: pseudouridine synthase [Terracidiphilus sp.]|jgi:23S rRNA pseudouridine2605 synthase
MAKKKASPSSEVESVVPETTETGTLAKAKAKAPAKPKATPKAKKPAKAPVLADPIGDETDGEANIALEAGAVSATASEIEGAEVEALAQAEIEGAAYTANEPAAAPVPESKDEVDLDAEPAAGQRLETEGDVEDESDSESTPGPRPPAKLERLQKILAQAGVASRRKAEEMIEQGRVQVNGKTVTELGTKADGGRDHIRVDGKLLHGAERLRYFVLNKPKGFVTTVKDPEGRPTVMQFFDKFKERLYPVGRLDYMSEGLLLVTNDGELANRLTRASAGVEKTYLVKVAGQPTEGELDILRAGVAIERGGPGTSKVRTAPARIRQVRQGDNPWYEVVLIEGRNRELRKMFEEIGHFVEKIRRVGYGPLVLDQEPGNLRELDPKELVLLRKAADGSLRTPKSKDLRRRNAADAGHLPTVAPKPSPRSSLRPAYPAAAKSFEERPAPGPKDYLPKRAFERETPAGSPTRPNRPPVKEFGASRPAWKKDDRPSRPPARFAAGSTGESRPPAGKSFGAKPFGKKPFGAKPFGAKPFGAKPYDRSNAEGRPYTPKPESAGADRPKPPANRTYSERPSSPRPFTGKPAEGRSFPAKPAWKKPEGQQWPPYKRPPAARPAPPRREPTHIDDDLGPVRPPNLHIEEIKASDRPTPSRSGPRPSSYRPAASGGRSSALPSGSGRSSSERAGSSRSFRGEGGMPRPFTTSSGKPRAGGARPNNKPGRTGDRPSSTGWKPGGRPNTGAPARSFGSKPGGSARPSFRREEGEGSFAPRSPRTDSGSGSRPGGKPGWKPKPSFGGKGRPGAGSSSRPPFKSGSKPGGFSKSSFKGKPGGRKHK